MTLAVRFSRPTARHARYIGRHMRAMDVRECLAFGRAPLDAIEIGVAGSISASVIMVDGLPAGVFGLSPVCLVGGVGRPWALGTDALYGHARLWMTEAALAVDRMAEVFPMLENWAHRDNHASRRWLQRLGFSFDGPADIGGEPMQRFWRTRC